jgi:hypothetical protein
MMSIEKYFITPIVMGSLVLAACDQKPKNPVSEYGDTLLGARQRAQEGAETANLDAIKKSIEAYRAANDKYPESLKDIEGLLGSPVDPSKYDYNPQTGTVALKVQK